MEPGGTGGEGVGVGGGVGGYYRGVKSFMALLFTLVFAGSVI